MRNSRGGDYGGRVHCVVRGVKCYVGFSMGYDYTFSKGGDEGRGVIYEHAYVPGIVEYTFG